jgi:hypothetical protein
LLQINSIETCRIDCPLEVNREVRAGTGCS